MNFEFTQYDVEGTWKAHSFHHRENFSSCHIEMHDRGRRNEDLSNA